MILSWDKPEKVMSTEAWKALSADGAPPGVYVPNMSDEDAAKWKAKVKYAKTEHPQVEIRKTVRGSQMLVIVGLDGWKYQHESPEGTREVWGIHNATKGHQVRMSVNGPLWWTWSDFLDLTVAAWEACKVLEALSAQEG